VFINHLSSTSEHVVTYALLKPKEPAGGMAFSCLGLSFKYLVLNKLNNSISTILDILLNVRGIRLFLATMNAGILSSFCVT
jgi:hypothetical protein